MKFRIAVMLFAAFAPLAVSAQETDTEKAAARDVLRRMAELEQSLDVPGLVARLTGANPQRDAVVARAKELLDTELLAMAEDIATHPEIGFQEKRSVEILARYLRQHDFEVEMGVARLPTAFVAKFQAAAVPPTSGSSSSTTPCAERRGRFTAISTARRGRSASPSRSPSRSSWRGRTRPGA